MWIPVEIDAVLRHIAVYPSRYVGDGFATLLRPPNPKFLRYARSIQTSLYLHMPSDAWHIPAYTPTDQPLRTRARGYLASLWGGDNGVVLNVVYSDVDSPSLRISSRVEVLMRGTEHETRYAHLVVEPIDREVYRELVDRVWGMGHVGILFTRPSTNPFIWGEVEREIVRHHPATYRDWLPT